MVGFLTKIERALTSASSRTQVGFAGKLVSNKNIQLLQQKPKTLRRLNAGSLCNKVHMEHFPEDKWTKPVSIYTHCMEEVKFRYNYLDSLFARDRKNLNFGKKWLLLESVALQYRKIIELIAFSTIGANETQYSKVRADISKDWNAKYIFKDIERINPKFYPVPISGLIPGKTKDDLEIIDEFDSGYLTKESSIKLYEKCSGYLHAENRFSVQQKPDESICYLESKLDELNKLLNWHWVYLIPDSLQYIVGLNLDTDQGIQIYGSITVT